MLELRFFKSVACHEPAGEKGEEEQLMLWDNPQHAGSLF
jgi:hypothetical protein